MACDPVTSLLPDQLSGKIGFFWIVPHRNGTDAVLGDAIPLAEAEVYGDVLTHPGGHFVYWCQMKRHGPTWLRAKGISGQLLKDEYEDWPRGRVVFMPSTCRFTLYADRRILRPARLSLLRTFFELGGLDLELRRDSHYQPVPRHRMIEPWQ